MVTDGSKSYKAAIDRHLPRATHVLDRFHVVGWFAAGLTLVRRDLQRREPRGQVKPAFDPELFRARFALLRRSETLTEFDRTRLDEPVSHLSLTDRGLLIRLRCREPYGATCRRGECNP